MFTFSVGLLLLFENAVDIFRYIFFVITYWDWTLIVILSYCLCIQLIFVIHQ